MRANGNQSATSPTSPRPVGGVTVQEAADLLGTTVDGVRSRIKRGTLDSAKVAGAVYVLLSPDQPPPSFDQPGLGGTSFDQSATSPEDRDALLAAKDETIYHLRRELDARNEELRRKDHIIMSLTQRVPELEVPTEPRDAPETAPETSEGASSPKSDTVVTQEGAQEPEGLGKQTPRRPWWLRWMGG
ncbi:MAG: helix-turn-helix domain-containing protein [Actinomycetota bacterium]|nr:helix-turn-helix domain-containing protein [Actinomycetota bacterium]